MQEWPESPGRLRVYQISREFHRVLFLFVGLLGEELREKSELVLLEIASDSEILRARAERPACSQPHVLSRSFKNFPPRVFLLTGLKRTGFFEAGRLRGIDP